MSIKISFLPSFLCWHGSHIAVLQLMNESDDPDLFFTFVVLFCGFAIKITQQLSCQIGSYIYNAAKCTRAIIC